MAFPFSTAGRDSRDYYWVSVAIGLAPRRRSRLPIRDGRYQSDVGAPFGSLAWLITTQSFSDVLTGAYSHSPASEGQPGLQPFYPVRCFYCVDPGVQAIQPSPCHSGLADRP